MARRGLVCALTTALLASMFSISPAADARDRDRLVPVPEVCDGLGLPNELCLPVQLINALLVPITPEGPIEARFSGPGPWSVVYEPHYGCCDSSGNAFDVFRPAHLGITGRHPIITWGNGTGGNPAGVAYFLRHLASWGFVVVATREQNTGAGTEILDAARFMVEEDRNRGSDLYGRLATRRIGAIGHSQGAAGAVAAMNQSDGLISTAVALHMPNPYGCGTPPGADAEGCRTLYRNATGPIFLVSGTFDFPISTAAGNREYYDLIPDGTEKAMGLLRGTTHNDIQGKPGCPLDPPAIGCFNGAYGYLGYPVAWMMYQLEGDRAARQAFRSAGDGEIFDNPHWTDQATSGI